MVGRQGKLYPVDEHEKLVVVAVLSWMNAVTCFLLLCHPTMKQLGWVWLMVDQDPIDVRSSYAQTNL